MNNRSPGQMAVGSAESGSGSIHAKGRQIERGIKGRYRVTLGFAMGLALVWGAAGCHKTTAQGTQADAGDPADVNMAPVNNGDGYAPGQPAQVMGQSAQNEAQQRAEEYSQQPPAPVERRAPYSGNVAQDNGAYPPDYADQQAADEYASDLTDEEASEPPPPLPQYEQPPAPDPDYLWTPGYWAWSPMGYYWVPGCWVAAPYAGALWTPGYWGFVGERYRFHHGFWGLHIGFYGGVNYGFGYFGYGYDGGYWDHDHFRYNTAVNRIDDRRIRNVYVHEVPQNFRTTNVRISFNGGRGGVQARPREAEVAVLHEQRHAPMQSQIQVQHDASQNRQQFFNQNRGRPAVAVSARPVIADRTPLAVLPRAAGPVGQPGGRNDMRQGQGQFQGRQGQPQQGQPDQGRPQNGQPQRGQPQFQGRQGQPQPEVRQPQQQGQPQTQVRPGQPQQGQPQPGQVQPEFRRGQPQQGQPQPQVRQGQPQQGQPQPQAQPEFRRGQSQQGQPQPQVRPAQPQQAQPQQAQPQPQPQVRQAPPQPEFRRGQPQQGQPQPQPQVRQAPQPPPQPQVRQAPPQPQPQPQMRQAPPQPQPQPQMRQAPPQPQPQPQMRQAPPQPQPQPQVRQAQPQPQVRQAPPQPAPQAQPAPAPRQDPQRGDRHKDEQPH
jgi:hypothetical protein